MRLLAKIITVLLSGDSEEGGYKQLNCNSLCFHLERCIKAHILESPI